MLTLDWFWFWQKPEIDFVTPMSLDECQSQFSRAFSSSRSIFETLPGKTVIGEIEDHKFYLTKKSPWWFRDDFKPYLYGSLVSTPFGTRVRASFRLHPVITLVLIFGISTLFILSAGDILSAQKSFWSLTIFAFFWIIFLASFILIGWFGSWSNKSNRDMLVDYLRKTLLSS